MRCGSAAAQRQPGRKSGWGLPAPVVVPALRLQKPSNATQQAQQCHATMPKIVATALRRRTPKQCPGTATQRRGYSKSASYCYPALVIASVFAKQPSRSKVAVLGCFVASLLAMTI